MTDMTDIDNTYRISEFFEGSRRASLIDAADSIRVVFYEGEEMVHQVHVSKMSQAERLAEDFVQGRSNPRFLSE